MEKALASRTEDAAALAKRVEVAQDRRQAVLVQALERDQVRPTRRAWHVWC